jgi:hypothetical protein
MTSDLSDEDSYVIVVAPIQEDRLIRNSLSLVYTRV